MLSEFKRGGRNDFGFQNNDQVGGDGLLFRQPLKFESNGL